MYNIEVGSYWRAHSKFQSGIASTDVIAKILHVDYYKDRVRVIRTTNYGFMALPPQSFTISEFLSLYDQDEMIDKNEH